jgi:hypothetical protein
LSLFYAGAIVYVKFLDIARLLGVNVNLLKRHQLGGERDLASERLPPNLRHADCYSLLGLPLGANPPAGRKKTEQNDQEADADYRGRFGGCGVV